MAQKKMTTDVLILGGGIGGYECFRHLSKLFKKKNINKTITIVDRNNFFTFTPLLHEVATGSVEPTHASVSLRELIHKTPHKFLRADVQAIDPKKKEVKTSSGAISYDYCVLALGSTTNFFGVPGAEEFTHQVRTLHEALALQSDLLGKLETCDRCPLTINVVGGGYTGVEIASELAQIASEDFKKLYPEAKININIVQSGDVLLKVLPEKVQKKVSARLQKFGINVILNDRAVKVTKDTLFLKSGETLDNGLTIWTTGFTTIAETVLPSTYVERDRVIVNNYLQSVGSNYLYTVGDMALVRDPRDETIIYPQLGEAAHMEGIYAAKHITATIQKRKIPPFTFKAKGTLIPVGEWYGVAIFGKIILFGKLAWWMRRTAYLAFMPGWLRRIRIAFDWTLNIFGFRHIIDINENKTNKKSS